MRIAIIVPIFNEIKELPSALVNFKSLISQGFEVTIVDGGSNDGSANFCRENGLEVLNSPMGRANQMNFGAANTNADLLVFLHIDTILPESALDILSDWFANHKTQWGRFDVKIFGQSMMLPIIATMMNVRSRIFHIATGDQVIFIRRQTFVEFGGFANIPLMEDIEICKRLRKVSTPYFIGEKVQTSGRRWDKNGVWKTIFLMWGLRFDYWRGISPEILARKYK